MNTHNEISQMTGEAWGMTTSATKTSVYNTKRIIFNVKKVFFDARTFRESRAAEMQQHARAAHFEFLIALLASTFVLDFVPRSLDEPPRSVPSSIASASSPPCILDSFGSGVKGGMAENAVLAQNITIVANAEANATSGSV
jgi:hypothetical protein